MSVHLLASALVSVDGREGPEGGGDVLLLPGVLPSDESLGVLAESADPEVGGLGGGVSKVVCRQLTAFPATMRSL